MTLGKITIDSSLRYVPKIEQTKEKDDKPKTIKADSLPRRQNKNISRNSKKFFNNVAAGGFGILK